MRNIKDQEQASEGSEQYAPEENWINQNEGNWT